MASPAIGPGRVTLLGRLGTAWPRAFTPRGVWSRCLAPGHLAVAGVDQGDEESGPRMSTDEGVLRTVHRGPCKLVPNTLKRCHDACAIVFMTQLGDHPCSWLYPSDIEGRFLFSHKSCTEILERSPGF